MVREHIVARLFVAFHIAEETRHQILEWQRDLLRALGADARTIVRAVPPEKFHITTAFIGEVDPSREEQIRARFISLLHSGVLALEDPDRSPAVTVDSLGAFPDRRRPRVVWIGIGDPSGTLASVATVYRHTFTADSLPLVPHVTIAYVRPDLSPEKRHLLRDVLNAFSPDPGPALTTKPLATPIPRIALVRSTSGSGGSRYEDLEWIDL